jgi:hypothetical protein
MIPFHTAQIPLAVQIVFDDVGWWSGSDDSAQNGPYRTGMPKGRNHCLKDYQAIARLGRLTGMRPQCAFVIGEWDVDNILRDAPGSNPMGKHWDNPFKNHPEIPATARFIRENNHKTFEVGFHALLHEFWPDPAHGAPATSSATVLYSDRTSASASTGTPKMERTEWHGPQGQPRPATWASHIAAWKAIWARHDFGPIAPISYVPCAGRHRFGSGFAKHLFDLGVRWINEPFSVMRHDRPTEHRYFGIEDGVYIIERMKDVAPWNALAHPPGPGLRHPYLGAHWTNILHENPDKNDQAVDAWVDSLKWYQNDGHTFLGTSTQQAGSQYIYQLLVSMWPEKDTIQLDFTQFDKHALPHIDDTFVIRAGMGKKPTATTPAPGTKASPFKLLSIKESGQVYDITLQRLTKEPRSTLAFV